MSPKIEMKICGLVLLTCVFSTQTPAQTRVDAGNQGRKVEFGNADSTKPIRTTGSLPMVCSVGEMTFLSENQPSGGLYTCVDANRWQAQSLPWIESQNTNAILAGWRDTARWSSAGGDWIEGLTAGSMTVVRLHGLPLNLSTPASGQTMFWDGTSWSGRASSSAGGYVTVKAGPRLVGKTGSIGFHRGAGLQLNAAAAGDTMNLTHGVDTEHVLIRAGRQSNSDLFCNSTVENGVTFRCSSTVVPRSLRAGSILYVHPNLDVAQGMETEFSLQLDRLAAVPLRSADGQTTLKPGELRAGDMKMFWYDSVQFREVGAASEILNAQVRPDCEQGLRGRIWNSRGLEGAQDEIAVCVRNETGTYLWQRLN